MDDRRAVGSYPPSFPLHKSRAPYFSRAAKMKDSNGSMILFIVLAMVALVFCLLAGIAGCTVHDPSALRIDANISTATTQSATQLTTQPTTQPAIDPAHSLAEAISATVFGLVLLGAWLWRFKKSSKQ